MRIELNGFLLFLKMLALRISETALESIFEHVNCLETWIKRAARRSTFNLSRILFVPTSHSTDSSSVGTCFVKSTVPALKQTHEQTHEPRMRIELNRFCSSWICLLLEYQKRRWRAFLSSLLHYHFIHWKSTCSVLVNNIAGQSGYLVCRSSLSS